MTAPVHTERCVELRAEVDALHAETRRLSDVVRVRRSRPAETRFRRALAAEQTVRARLIACHIGEDAECYEGQTCAAIS